MVKSGVFGAWNPLHSVSIKLRLLFVIGTLSLLLAAIGGLGIVGMSGANDKLGLRL